MPTVLREETKAEMPTSLRIALDIFAYYGFPAVTAIALFAVVFGFIPSPMLVNQELLRENHRDIQAHVEETASSNRRLINLSLAQCVNAAMDKGDTTAARVCMAGMEDSDMQQRRLINRLIEGREAGETAIRR